MPRGKWTSVSLPDEIIKKIDEIIEKDKYPIGKWRNRSHFIVEMLKEKLRELEEKKEEEK